MAPRLYPILAAVALPLAACGTVERTTVVTGTTGGADTSASACVEAVETNSGSSATVLSLTPTAEGAAVLVRSRDGTAWNCTASPQGVVTGLSVA